MLIKFKRSINTLLYFYGYFTDINKSFACLVWVGNDEKAVN